MSNRTWPSARVKRRPWLHFWGNFSEGVTGFPARVKPWRPWWQIEPWSAGRGVSVKRERQGRGVRP